MRSGCAVPTCVRGFAPYASKRLSARHQRRPDGLRHDLACPPTGIPHVRWVSRGVCCSDVEDPAPRLGFFVLASQKFQPQETRMSRTPSLLADQRSSSTHKGSIDVTEALLEHPGLEPRRTGRAVDPGRVVQTQQAGKRAEGQVDCAGVLQPVHAHPYQLRAGCISVGRACGGLAAGQGCVADRVQSGHGHGRRHRRAHRRSGACAGALRRPDRCARVSEVRGLVQGPRRPGAQELCQVFAGAGDQHGNHHPPVPGVGACAGAAGTLRYPGSARQEVRADLDLPPQAAEHSGGQLGADHRHPHGHGRDPAVPDAGLHPGSALHGLGRAKRGRKRWFATGQP